MVNNPLPREYYLKKRFRPFVICDKIATGHKKEWSNW